jgi:hypothetical protein
MKNLVTALAVAALCVYAWAADNAAVGTSPTANLRSAIGNRQSSLVSDVDAITIPKMLSYQGKLTDTLGASVEDSTYSATFRLYTVPSGGSPYWNETKIVTTRAGLFSTLLGSVTPIGAVPDAGTLYLGMAVGGGAELTPRLRIVSVAYAYKADTANYALASAGGGCAWVRVGSDSVLYTIHKLGIAKGEAANALRGDSAFTHVNLGIACTTGFSGQYSHFSTVGGGVGNKATDNYATVGGGARNTADDSFATIGGGDGNTASGTDATVGGGYHCAASGWAATVGGGEGNAASGGDAAIPGGRSNAARGDYSFAAGSYAKANADGSSVWNDYCPSATDSTSNNVANRWVARARGGVYFYTSLDRSTGSYLSAGGNSWNQVSDSMTKENFRPVDRKTLLERLAQMRVRDYNLKTQDPSIRHIGPVAQDFHNAFGFGESNTAINMEDADGVLLAAVQALYEQNQQLFDQNRQMMAELEALKAELAKQK